MTSLAGIRQSLLGWVYPPVCGSCDAPLTAGRQLEKPFLCGDCEEALVPIGDDYCRICGQSYETTMSPSFGCANCRDRELGFDFAVSAYRSSGMARELMHRFKYGREMHLSRLMGVLIQRVWEDERFREVPNWLVVPVPLHSRRLRERGFNQSREIAIELIRRRRGSGAEKKSLSLYPALRRVKHTVRQAQLDRRERMKNPAGAFAVRKRFSFSQSKGVGLLVVDDVMTTGTTASECAAVLRRSFDVEAVAAVSVMRG